MEPQQIRLEVSLEASDVVRASWELLLRRAGVLFAAWCVLAGVAGYFAVGDAAALDWPTLAVVSAMMVGPPAILVAVVVWNAQRKFRQAETELRPIHYCIHDDGMDVASVKRSGWIPWEGFREAIETPSAFLVFLEKDQHYLLPKRCFAAADDIDGLRRLLADGIRSKT
jgi:hypothetical protein